MSASRRPIRLIATTIGLVSLLLAGCATTSTVKQPAYVASFNFTPPENAAPGSAGVAFAIVNARFTKDEAWTKEAPFTTFGGNLNADFQELLNARGYTVRGPFAMIDEMTFPDKKGSDLALQPTLELTFDPVAGSAKLRDSTSLLGSTLGSAKSYTAEVDYNVAGRVTLAITEPLSGERMWFKSVPVQGTQIHLKYPANASGQGQIDLAQSVELSQALDQAYANIMDAAWKYLDPGEMALVKKQGEEIRVKKVY
jgi:hypothetical protein